VRRFIEKQGSVLSSLRPSSFKLLQLKRKLSNLPNIPGWFDYLNGLEINHDS